MSARRIEDENQACQPSAAGSEKTQKRKPYICTAEFEDAAQAGLDSGGGSYSSTYRTHGPPESNQDPLVLDLQLDPEIDSADGDGLYVTGAMAFPGGKYIE